MKIKEKPFVKIAYARPTLLGDFSTGTLSDNIIEHCKAKYRNEIALNNSFIGYGLLSSILPKDCTIKWKNNGKPYVNNGLSVSISHTDSLIVASVSNVPCAIDVETKSKVTPVLSRKILDCCSEKIFALQKEEQKIDFLTKIWCLKECLIKLDVGYSMSDLKDITVIEKEGIYIIQDKYYGKIFDYGEEYFAILSNRIIDNIIIDNIQ